jgi:hypothetical protein
MGRKMLFTLNIDNYAPGITRLTFPLMRFYAHKIGAEFHVISARRYPDWPIPVEKLQIYDLAREAGVEWALYFDADALIHPETVDFTQYLPKDTVAHNGSDMAGVRWRANPYFLRDGRHIGSCNWCTIASEWCLDVWHPPIGETLDKVVDCVYPTIDELNTIITPEHLVDDYLVSRNIARFGLKFQTLMALQKRIGLPDANFFWHQYVITIEEKIKQMEEILTNVWKIPTSLRA